MLAQRRYRFGEFTLDLKRGALFRGPSEVRLRPKSFAVLQTLVERHGELITKEEMLERVWGRAVVTDGVITQCLIDVRRAIGDDSQEIIRTLPRRGYLFAAAVSTADEQPVQVEAAQEIALPEPQPTPSPSSPPASEPDRPPSPSPESVAGRSPWSRRPPALALLVALTGALAWWGAASLHEATATSGAAPARVGEARKAIAVLPFVDLTGDPDGEYIADGIAEEVLHLLVEADGLRVVARTSSFAFKGQPTGIQDIAAKLHVDYLVEGSVRRAGTNLRVNAQLIDASSSSEVWSKAYERDVRDLLAVQQDIAQHIATALQASLGDRPPAASDVADPAAYDTFLRARFLFNRRLPGDMEKAEHAYQETLRLDPRFARAWAGLAGIYGAWIGEPGADVPALLKKQREAIDSAIALDPRLAEARIRAAGYFFKIGDRIRAEQEAAIARDLAPDDPAVLWWSANHLAHRGHLDEAIEIQRRVVGSDPLSRVPRVNLANTLLAAGRLDEARAEFLNFLQLGTLPDPSVTVELARIDLLSGRYTEAMAAAEKWPAGPDRDFVLAVGGAALARPDVVRSAESRLRTGAGPAEAVRLAELYAYRHESDQAFRWMNVAYDRLGPNPWLTAQWQWMYHLRFSPFFRSLHADARWQETMQRAEAPRVQPAHAVPKSTDQGN